MIFRHQSIKSRLLTLLSVLGLALTSPLHALVINEFMAVNDSVHTNASGAFDDWIEIYNPGTSTVSLAGWHLSDNAGNLTKWAFPAVDLAADAYVLVYASGSEDAVVEGDLHADFKLDGSGEYLGLSFQANPVHAYSPTCPAQSRDISYGLGVTNGQRYFDVPTPGLPNTAGFLPVEAPQFSHSRGFYSNAFAVTLTCSTPGAQIRYTTDLSWPSTSHGTVYSNALQISGVTCLRAIAFKSGDFTPSAGITHTYVFEHGVLTQPASPPGFPMSSWGHANADYEMDPDITTVESNAVVDALTALPTVSVVLPIDDMFGSGGAGIYPTGEGILRSTSFEYFDPATGQSLQLNCGINIFGGSSVGRWKTDKLQFRLRFKAPFGPTKLEAQLFGPGTAREFDNLVLNARLANTWTYNGGVAPQTQRARAQFIREQYAANIHNDMLGLGPHGNHVHLYVCGLYWGIYGLHERTDESFAHQYYGGDPDDYEVQKSQEIAQGDGVDYLAMRALANAGVASLAAYEMLKEHLSIPEFIDYTLMYFYLSPFDWKDRQNWYATRNSTDPDGLWYYHQWDAEHSLEGIGDNVTGASGSFGPQGLHQKLTENTEYRMLFADHVQRHFFNGGALTPASCISRYHELADVVEPAIPAESARWGDNVRPDHPYTLTNDWAAEQTRLLTSFFPARSDAVLSQISARGLFPAVDAPTFNQFGGAITGDFFLVVSATDPIYFTTDGSDPREYGTAAVAGTLYTAPVLLPHSTHVKARALDGGVWSALTEAVFTAQAAGALFVSELMYHPRAVQASETNLTTTRADFEFIELQNRSVATIGLAGLTFTDGILFDFEDSAVTALAPDDYVIIVRNLEAFKVRYPNWASLNIAGEFGTRYSFPQTALDDKGERLRLEDALSTVLIDLRYEDARSWPIETDGAGHSLVPKQWSSQADGSMAYGALWRASAWIDGSPGAIDITHGPGILINEINAHTDTALAPPLDSDDWIEVYNASTSSVDISGWHLSDGRDSLAQYTVPPGTVVDAGHHLRLSENTHFHTNRLDGSGFGLDKAGEQIYLSHLPGGGADRVMDAVRFKGQENSISWGRFPDGDRYWQTLPPTPATTNIAPAAHVVISEIMYNASTGAVLPDATFEYVELYNPQTTTVALSTVAGEWRIDGGIDFDFPSGVSVAPRDYLVLVPFDPTNTSARFSFFAAYALTNGQVTLMGPYRGQLHNRTERVALERPQEADLPGQGVSWVVVDEVTYYDREPWPSGTDGSGAPLQRAIGSRAGDDPLSWFNGFVPTPGIPGTPLAIVSPPHTAAYFVPTVLPVTLALDPGLDTNQISHVSFLEGTNVLCALSAPPYECTLTLAEVRDYTVSALMATSTTTYTSRQVVVSGVMTTNLPATDITEEAACLHARIVGPDLDDVLISFGTTDGGIDPGAWQHVHSTMQSSGAMTACVSGLVPGQTYFYRAFGRTPYSSGWALSSSQFTTRSLTEWVYRMPVSFPSVDSGLTLTNFPVLIRLSNGINGFDYSQVVSSNAYDLRFVGDGQFLDYEVSHWDTNGESEVWVRMPTLTAGSSLQCYWGHADIAMHPPPHNPADVWSGGYFGVWHLNGTLHESTGSGFVADRTGTVVAPGVSSSAFGFSAAPDSIDLDVPGSTLSSHMNNLTVLVWARPEAGISTLASVFGAENGSSDISAFVNTSPFVRKWRCNVMSNEYTVGSYSLGAWQMLGMVLDSGTARAALNDSTDIALGPYPALGALPSLALGRRNATGHHFKGAIDECRLSRVARPPQWLKAEYQSVAQHGSFVSYGQVVQQTAITDADQDGLPDAWEVQWLGSTSLTANAYSDSDTFSNIEEYIAGTDPTNAASQFILSISNAGPSLALGFQAVAADGAGYDGLTRRYDMLYATNGVGALWQYVPDYTNLAGDDQWQVLPQPRHAFPVFYRIKARLETE